MDFYEKDINYSGVLLVFLFFTAMVVVPIIFKPQLVKLVKKEANNNINATLECLRISGLNLYMKICRMYLSISNI